MLAQATALKALLLALRDRFSEALMLFRGTIDLLGDDGDLHELLTAHHNSADLLQQSDMPGAEAHLQAAIDLCGRIGDRGGLAFATANRMALHQIKGEWDEAEAIGHRIVDSGNPVNEYAVVNAQLASLAALRGDRGAAAGYLDKLSHLGDSDDVQDRTIHAAFTAFLEMLGGRFGEAFEVAAEATHLTLAGLGVRTEPFRLAWPTAVEAGLAAGRLDDVESLINVVATRPIGTVPPYLRAQLARFNAMLAAARGDTSTVEADFATAVRILAELGYPYWQAVVQTDLARWLLEHGRSGEASSLLDEAAAVADRLRAAPQQSRISSVRAGVGAAVG